jgi:DNA-binding GntR family transcriptional regulator
MSIYEMTVPTEWPAGGLVEDVAELLRERIADGRTAPSSAPSEDALADELGVSGEVMADALGMLRTEGVIALARPVPAMSVLPGDDWSILLSAYALREQLDGLAARLAAERVGAAIEPVLHAALDQQRRALDAGDRVRAARADARFSCALIDASGNHFLPFHTALVRSSSRSAATLLDAERLARGIDQQRALLDAVCAGDGARAERLARARVRTTLEALEAAG